MTTQPQPDQSLTFAEYKDLLNFVTYTKSGKRPLADVAAYYPSVAGLERIRSAITKIDQAIQGELESYQEQS